LSEVLTAFPNVKGNMDSRKTPNRAENNPTSFAVIRTRFSRAKLTYHWFVVEAWKR